MFQDFGSVERIMQALCTRFIDTTAVLSSPLPTDSSHPNYSSRHLGTFPRRSYSSPRRTDPTSYKTSQATWTHFQSSWHSSELRLSRPIDSCYSRQLSPDFRLSKTISRTPVSEMIVVLVQRHLSIIDSCHIASQTPGNVPKSLDHGLASKRKTSEKRVVRIDPTWPDQITSAPQSDILS